MPTEDLFRFFFDVDGLSSKFGSLSWLDESACIARALASLSSKIYRSSFFFSIHQTAPAASQAFVSTEWTIWAVSNPRVLKVFKRWRSVGVEKMIGVGVDNNEAKSDSRPERLGKGVDALSVAGEPESERIDDTERRFVRAGVRIGCGGGGALALAGPDQRRGEGAVQSSPFSSITVVGCLSAVFASREGRDSRSEANVLRIVELLGWRCNEPPDRIRLAVLSKGSLVDSSGVVGVEDIKSGCLIKGESDS
jgi:hypothetical protein